MIKRKQFTIIARGNRCGEYYVNGLNEEGMYSKWCVTYRYYPKWDDYKQINVENIDYNLRPREISTKTIKRTKEFYDTIHQAKGEYPYWLDQLK